MNKFSNQQAEQAILGTIILSNIYLPRVSDFLEEKHFFYPAHKAIYRRILEVIQEMVANQITLKEFFSSNEEIKACGGVSYLVTLLGSAESLADIRDYAFSLIELWQKREVEMLLTRSLLELSEKKYDAIAATLENELAGLSFKESKKKTQHISELISEMENDERVGISSKFVPTGFPNLDAILNGGIHAQQLVIIGARPSAGKTSICQNIILNASRLKKKCLFVSLEVDKRNVTLKFLSNLSSLETWKICKTKLNQFEEAALIRAKSDLREMGIYTNDSSYLRIGQIGQIIKNQIEKQPVDLVVVDYVQIIRGDDAKLKNEAQIIKDNTTLLKAFAKQYDVAMLALAQINRKGVEGSRQEPTINDFKGSGGIEEDADVAIILHRDRSEEEKDEGYFSKSGKLIVAKNRHGRTGEIPIVFDGNFGRFMEMGRIQ